MLERKLATRRRAGRVTDDRYPNQPSWALRMVHSYFWPTLAIAAVGMFFSLRWLIDFLPEYHVDLEVYQFGVQAWWRGDDIYGTLPPVAGGEGGHLPYLYPPFALLALGPLALVPLKTAAAIMIGLGLLALAATLYVTARHLWPHLGARGAVMITMLILPATVFLEPVNGTFGFGQVSLILMALVTIDCLAPKTPWPRGMAIGIAAAIKLTPLAFLLYFLINKNTRATITTLITLTTTTLTGFLIDFTASTNYWFGGTITNASQIGSVFLNNQSMTAVLARAGLPEETVNLVWLVAAVVLFALVVVAMRRSNPAMAMLLNAGLLLLVSPTSWSHYWVWVVPAVLIIGVHTAQHWQHRSLVFPGWLGAGLMIIALCYLAPFFHLPPTEASSDEYVGWSFEQQLFGASYVLLGIFLILAYSLPRLRKPRLPMPAFEPPVGIVHSPVTAEAVAR